MQTKHLAGSAPAVARSGSSALGLLRLPRPEALRPQRRRCARCSASASPPGQQQQPQVQQQQQQVQQLQQQQQPEQELQQPQQPPEQHSSSWYKSNWDMNLFHYAPWWLQPVPILLSGAAFFAAALLIDNDDPIPKAAVIAAGPVALYYVIALVVLPSQFQRFAVQYMRKHPELEAQAVDPRGSQDGDGGLSQS
ncbi:hypothetical protein Rsub_10378 [Raphidocelis subcapitata]|uniref:Uncharacterized protein n=1 Tax=Raphidocelis subcapitata TaxID=307507 RepID=A0A2V0PK94_9CHLO|nr:hypothetical protein Rsub_10378 [Raphidocelis subcapitata]|eukprot:GBF97455.1 hypothetical protein Rsub_10378 [Raphidocelis subcapitata]